MLATDLRDLIDNAIELYGDDIEFIIDKNNTGYEENIEIKKATVTRDPLGIEVDEEPIYDINVNCIVLK